MSDLGEDIEIMDPDQNDSKGKDNQIETIQEADNEAEEEES